MMIVNKQQITRRFIKVMAMAFTLLPISLYSQSGPGGFEDTSGTSDLVLWLQADAGVLNGSSNPAANGEAVNTWQDQSGYGYNAATAATSPLFTSSNANFGNMPTITFAGGATEFLFVEDDANEAPQLDNTSALSVFYVFREANISDVRAHVSKRDGNGIAQSYVFFQNGGINSRINSNSDAGATVAVNTTYINALTYQSTSFEHFLNQTSGGSNATSAIPNNDSDLHIGTLNAGDSRNLEGDIAEVIIFRRFLTNAERIVVETYLGSKYGISLTSDFWDEVTFSTYDNEIAGIGQHSDGTIANSATSSILTISGGDGRANDEWLFWGHDTGDISTWDNSFSEVPGTEERLTREWVVNETGELGNVTVTINNSDLPATGFTVPNYFLLVDSDGDADFSNATRHTMIPNASGATVDVNLNNNDRVTIAFEGGATSEIWYSFVSGNWDDPTTWTLDGAIAPLFNNPSNEIPSTADSVVIQSGRTVTMNVNNASVTRMEIIGTLDLAATTGHIFGVLDGSGTLRLSGAAGVENYPTADDTPFIDASSGGTLEYYGTGLTVSTVRNANNLRVDMTDPMDVVTILSDVSINGNFTIANGFFQFNDNSSTTNLNVTVDGNLLVTSTGGIDVGTANARHEFNLNGDFVNQGDVDFTNRTTQVAGSEATDGIVDVNFVSGTQDQTVTLQNTTDFYRIEVNKGVDDTFVVEISATDPSFFNLYGFANEVTNSAQLTSNNNALGLIFGTIRVGSNVTISPLNASSNYSIFEGSSLWVDGGTVEKTAGTAIVPYGEVRVSAGILNAPINSGITTRENGLLTIEGGTVTVNQFRTSINGLSAQGGLVMSGGIFNITGGTTNTSFYTFSLTNTGNVFNMSGGVINLSGVNTQGGIFINSSVDNINVTGGTINLDVTNANNCTITSTAPFST